MRQRQFPIILDFPLINYNVFPLFSTNYQHETKIERSNQRDKENRDHPSYLRLCYADDSSTGRIRRRKDVL